MYARVFQFSILFTLVLRLLCVTMTKYHGPDIKSKSQEQLQPLTIYTAIGDIVIISAPIINSNTLYYLNKPNSDTFHLPLNISETAFYKQQFKEKFNEIVIQFEDGTVKSIITPLRKYSRFNIFERDFSDTRDVFMEKENSLLPNDFMIGPLLEEDHGNWVLSAFYKDNNGEWIEVYQLIAIEIMEPMQIIPIQPILDLGSDLVLRFEYPIKDLQTCEIIAPESTFDRFYDRDIDYRKFCGYRIPNVTKEDEGIWEIIGMGKIMYTSNVLVKINRSS